MSFYQTYRPTRFGDILGQDWNTEVIKRQSALHRINHAYILHGASGTGKTSMARLIAMSLNCYNPNHDGEPCGGCQSCDAIKRASHWDVIEVNATRLKGLDEVKDLCYRAYFSPLGNRKVYIIDECHQLTPHIWDALLKLIEEPPPHLCIILCTTQYDRIPETIASRCQIYEFKPITSEAIYSKLNHICQAIGLQPDKIHLQFIAESANGNMRTAENLLEQACVLEQPATCLALAPVWG